MGGRGTREGQRGRQRPQIKGLGYRAREEPSSQQDEGHRYDTADLISPQALATCLPAGSHAQDPARPALWLLSSPVRGPLCLAWTWSWWAVVTACHW